MSGKVFVHEVEPELPDIRITEARMRCPVCETPFLEDSPRGVYNAVVAHIIASHEYGSMEQARAAMFKGGAVKW